MKVAIFIGSESDFESIKEALEVLKRFGISVYLEITSAHRSPRRTLKLVDALEKEGVEVFIAAAGKAAHLAGFVASHTLHPVIGVPLEGGSFGGLDALLSTVQMPKGVPVATMGLGKDGAVNAAFLAVEIISLKVPELGERLKAYRENMAREIEKKSEELKNRA